MPNIGFTISHLAFSFPTVGLPKGHLYLNPRASAPLSVGPACQLPVATRGNSGLAYRKFGQSECALRKRYVQLLSGFVDTFGRCCWTCFTIVEDVLKNRDTESARNVSGGGLFLR